MSSKWEDANKAPVQIHLRSSAGKNTTLAILDSNITGKAFFLAANIHVSDSVAEPLAVCQKNILAMLLPLLEAEVDRLKAEVEGTT